MSEVKQLKLRRDENAEAVVAVLENLLAMAKAGKVVAIAVAQVNTSHYWTTTIEAGVHHIRLNGAINYLSWRMNNAIHDLDHVTDEEIPGRE